MRKLWGRLIVRHACDQHRPEGGDWVEMGTSSGTGGVNTEKEGKDIYIERKLIVDTYRNFKLP